MDKQMHTPGPYKYRITGSDNSGAVIAPDGKSVCAISSNIARPSAEKLANGALFAAAPELLQMAKGALDALSQPKTHQADIDMARQFLRFAIAKAEGQS